MRKKGFTLLELLISATLLAILAVFATSAYRNSTREISLEDLKNRARAVALGLQQYKEEYPNETFTGNASIYEVNKERDEKLNDFIDAKNLRDEHWSIFPCKGDGNNEGWACAKAAADKPIVCLVKDGKDPRFDNSYDQGCYAFCITETGEVEKKDDSCHKEFR